MSFDWSDLLEVVDYLSVGVQNAQPSRKESYYRSIINRAYYATFMSASEALTRRGISLEGRGDRHKQVVDFYFESKNIDNARRIAENLNRLRQLRRRSDYDSGWPHAAKNWYAAVGQSRMTLELIRGLDTSKGT